jgi:hypothetical protein
MLERPPVMVAFFVRLSIDRAENQLLSVVRSQSLLSSVPPELAGVDFGRKFLAL